MSGAAEAAGDLPEAAEADLPEFAEAAEAGEDLPGVAVAEADVPGAAEAAGDLPEAESAGAGDLPGVADGEAASGEVAAEGRAEASGAFVWGVPEETGVAAGAEIFFLRGFSLISSEAAGFAVGDESAGEVAGFAAAAEAGDLSGVAVAGAGDLSGAADGEAASGEVAAEGRAEASGASLSAEVRGLPEGESLVGRDVSISTTPCSCCLSALFFFMAYPKLGRCANMAVRRLFESHAIDNGWPFQRFSVHKAETKCNGE